MSHKSKKPSKSLSKPATAAKAPPPFHPMARAFAGFADGPPDASPQNRAQDLVYRAWEIPNPAKRVSLAKQALAIFPDCADALLLLADEQARTTEEALDLYALAVEAGARALGEAYFQENVGAFWGLHETRGYMRARRALAQMLWDFGERRAAIAHAQEMLRLNPADNQLVRAELMAWLLLAGRLEDANALWQAFAEDGLAHWQWSRALMLFIEFGDGDEANAALRLAIEANRFVGPMLLEREPMPEPSGYMGLGDPREAASYVSDDLQVWRQTEGALSWVKRALAAQVVSK